MKDRPDEETRSVKNHYERWPFPGCDFSSRESLLILKMLKELLSSRSIEGSRHRVLDVGCGTGNTLLALARQFPEVSFTGIDFSAESIRLAAEESRRRRLSNVAFKQADLQEDMTELGVFEVVLCFGVLHHVADMKSAFASIASRIKPDGHLFLWLYGEFGRTKHSLNQIFIGILCGDVCPEERFEVAREFLQQLGRDYACDSGFYTPEGSGEEGVSWLINHPEWLADQMIPACEQNVSMCNILDLFADSGLNYVKWLGVSEHLSSYTSSDMLLKRFDALSERERLLAIDHLVKPDYYLVVGRKT